MISSSVLRLCYVMHPRNTSTTTRLTKFTQLTPTSGISTPEQGSYAYRMSQHVDLYYIQLEGW